jgi:preprotein translocase subunit SecY
MSAYIPFIIFGLIALAMTAVITEVQQATRKIPIQSAQRTVGLKQVQSIHVRFHVLLYGDHVRRE